MTGDVILVLGSLQNHAAIVDVRGGQLLPLHWNYRFWLTKVCDRIR